MIRSTALLAVELIGLIIGVTFLVQLVQRRLGPDRIRDLMGGHPLVAALKGIGIGFVTPFCTYSAIPMLLGLRQARVATAGWVAFIVAAPVLDPILFGALSVIIGVEAALLYMVIAFAAALSLALVAEAVGIDAHLKPIDEPARVLVGASSAPADPPAVESWRGLRRESGPAWQASMRLLRTMLPLLAVGLGIGLAIESFVDAETAARITGEHEQLAIPLAAALGTPLYMSTELYIPIADSLQSAGVSIGAIVALTIAGAGANVPEFVLLGRIASRRLIGLFIAYVFTIAVLGGALSALLL
ncbi:MAG: permease [Acidimicrobiales bacterium]|nr:permease [Acidimicrobiales bacterium]